MCIGADISLSAVMPRECGASSNYKKSVERGRDAECNSGSTGSPAFAGDDNREWLHRHSNSALKRGCGGPDSAAKNWVPASAGTNGGSFRTRRSCAKRAAGGGARETRRDTWPSCALRTGRVTLAGRRLVAPRRCAPAQLDTVVDVVGHLEIGGAVEHVPERE